MNLQLRLLCFVSIPNIAFCADPYASVKHELGAFMSPIEIEKLIKEDEAARIAPKLHTASPLAESSVEKPIRAPFPPAKSMTDEERKAFRAQMVQNARNARFGNIGGK